MCTGKPTSGSETDEPMHAVNLTVIMIDRHVIGVTVSQSLTPVLAPGAQIWMLLTSQVTYLNPKPKEVHQLGTFRLPGTPNTNGLVRAHHLTGYSVRYTVVQIDRDCSHPNLPLFVMVFLIGRKP